MFRFSDLSLLLSYISELKPSHLTAVVLELQKEKERRGRERDPSHLFQTETNELRERECVFC